MATLWLFAFILLSCTAWLAIGAFASFTGLEALNRRYPDRGRNADWAYYLLSIFGPLNMLPAFTMIYCDEEKP